MKKLLLGGIQLKTGFIHLDKDGLNVSIQAIKYNWRIVP